MPVYYRYRTCECSGKSGNQSYQDSVGDQKVRATIGLLLEGDQLTLIKNCQTAKDTWEKLKGQYEKATLTSKVSILKRICDERFNDCEGINQHIYEKEDLFEKLTLAVGICR